MNDSPPLARFGLAGRALFVLLAAPFPLYAVDDPITSRELPLGGYFIYDADNFKERPFFYSGESVTFIPFKPSKTTDTIASGEPLRLISHSQTDFGVKPGANIHLQVTTNKTEARCFWSKNYSELCQSQKCDFSTLGWQFGINKIGVYCTDGTSAVSLGFAIRIIYGFMDPGEKDVTPPVLAAKAADAPPMTFGDAYVRALSSNVYVHQGASTNPLAYQGQKLSWDETIKSDVKGMALIGEADAYQHYLFEQSRVHTSLGIYGERVLDLAYGQLRSRRVHPGQLKFLIKTDDWLTLVPDEEADFIVTRSADSPDTVQLVVARGVVSARLYTVDLKQVLPPAAKQGATGRKEDRLSFQAQLIRTTGVYQRWDADNETIQVAAGMKVLLHRQKQGNDRAPVIARYDELALALERTTPEYFVYQSDREWMSEAETDVVQHDLWDPLHPRIVFFAKDPLSTAERDKAVAIAERAIKKRDFITALEALTPFARVAPKKDAALCLLAAEAYQGIAKGSLANKLYMRAIELDESLMDIVYYRLGLLAIETGHYQEALVLFAKLGAHYPSWRQTAEYYQGVAHLALDQEYLAGIALKESLWRGDEKILILGAEDLLAKLAAGRVRSWRAGFSVATNSNVFRLPAGHSPPENMPHRSTLAYRLDLDMTHYFFENQGSSVAVETGLAVDYYAKQQISVVDFTAGFAVSFTPASDMTVKVKPFLETIRVSGNGVDGFGLQWHASWDKLATRPEVGFASAQFFDTTSPQTIPLDPFTRETNERSMVAARYNIATGGFAPIRLAEPLKFRLYPSYAIYQRRDELARQDDFNRIAISGVYTFQPRRDLGLTSTLEWDHRAFPNAPAGRTDQGLLFKQDARLRVNAAIYAELFGEFLQNSSSASDASYKQNSLGSGVWIEF